MTPQKPPQPPGIPFLGHLLLYARDPLEVPRRWARDYGDVVHLRLGPEDVYQINHPDDIEQMLVKDFRKYRKDRMTRTLEELLGKGLVTSEGDFWKRQRRLVNPGFHRDRIKGYAEVMVSETRARIDGWGERSEFDVHDEMMRITLGIVASTLFGTDVSQQDADTIGSSIAFFMEYHLGIANTGIRLPHWIPTPGNSRAVKAMAALDEVIRRYIEIRRASGDTGDLLSMLISAVDDEGKGMDSEQLRDEALTLITAGHETTAVSMTMTLYLLSQHPEVEVKLHEELDRVLGDRQATFEDLAQLTYTEQVVTESMRVLPPVWGIGREAIEDTEIGGYPIKKGAQMFVSQWTVHRDSRFFPDPEAFKPERWTPEFKKQLPHYAYFPFGGGPRICVGKRFAMMEAVLLLATISRRYALRLLPGETLDLMPSVTIRPRNGLRMVAQRRPT